MRASAASKAASAASGSPDLAKALEQPRRQLGEHFARPGARHRRAAAKVPAADGLGGLLGMDEAKAAQGRQRLRIVGDAGEHQRAGDIAQARRLLEQPRIVTLDRAHLLGHRRSNVA